MRHPARSLFPVLAVVVAVVLAACGQDEDPEGARVLWEKINAAPGFNSWQRAPGYPRRMPSLTAHSKAVEIFVNDKITTVLTTPTTQPVTQWPVGSVIVKEGFSGSTRKIVAAMEKRDSGWFWAEYNGTGDTLFSGSSPSTCIDCHDNRKDSSDWVYAFELPR